MFLTNADVLDYVKRKLGFPINTIEVTDNDLLSVVKRYTIPLFSQYVPDVNEIVLNINDPAVQTGELGVYYLNEPDNQPILDVVKVIHAQTDHFLYAWPYPGVIGRNMPGVVNTILNLTESETSMVYGPAWPNFKFYPPNRLRILPSESSMMDNVFVVRYERYHPNFSTIPAAYARDFLELALADVYEYIASIRSKFVNYSTPWGEINLNWDNLQSRAIEIRERTIERLNQRPPDLMVKVI